MVVSTKSVNALWGPELKREFYDQAFVATSIRDGIVKYIKEKKQETHI